MRFPIKSTPKKLRFPIKSDIKKLRFPKIPLPCTADQMSELIQRNKSTISRHIKNVFEEGELSSDSTVAKYATVQQEGDRYVERNLVYYKQFLFYFQKNCVIYYISDLCIDCNCIDMSKKVQAESRVNKLA